MNGSDQRRHTRLPFTIDVHLSVQGRHFEASSRDICTDGIAVAGSHLDGVEVGAECEFTLWLVSGEQSVPVRGSGQVIREVSCSEGETRGLGIRFLDLDDDSRRILWRLIQYNAPRGEDSSRDSREGSTS